LCNRVTVRAISARNARAHSTFQLWHSDIVNEPIAKLAVCESIQQSFCYLRKKERALKTTTTEYFYLSFLSGIDSFRSIETFYLTMLATFSSRQLTTMSSGRCSSPPPTALCSSYLCACFIAS
jgi:hypothetical protein